MKRQHATFLAGILIGCGRPSMPLTGPVPTCHVTPSTIISDDGIGDLRIGERVDSVRQRCTLANDTTVDDDEGVSKRQVVVATANDSLTATVVDGRIWRIELTSGSLVTYDSLGLGTTLGRLLESADAHGLEGEGRLYVVTSKHCGLSFELGYSVPQSQYRSRWRIGDLRQLDSRLSVTRVLVVGCQQAVSR